MTLASDNSDGGSVMANFTKKAIKASFLKLLNEKPLNKITVRDIVEDCGINRNSFYYHFQDIPALLESIVEETTAELIAKYPRINSIDECFEAAFSFAIRSKRAVYHIFHSVNRDVFDRELMKLCSYAVTTYIDTAFPAHQSDEAARARALRFIKCEFFGLIIDWLNNGMRSDAIDDLRHIAVLCRELPDMLPARD